MKKKILLNSDKRRSIYDRRMLSYVTYSPERRSGGDRRFVGETPSPLADIIRIYCQE